MTVSFNDTPLNCSAGMSLEKLLTEQSLLHKRIAVAVNGNLIKRDLWGELILTEGADVVVIEATYGG
ncbi:hypothetical protein HR11_04260 [Porphyromonas macacae]|uniref:Thiamine biosynthesis protein ThiS n=1 Tax=Porphyromonas macacae TaxID=28115 RepID=A0A0A2GG70_9PORP|nr:sulfur carrier protein ThiS [Porphyromonas macacae]KGN73326.1 hypothetical protein HQ47_07575 [Porphyromonas macacae]KGN99474.1 hypothetical protein HR11_04260 [Porphyromonas macacae]SUB76937.1 Thiamine biosynthesis protein ThiS [Porphyromonas macacae]SUB87998.1 Thiamine biosynthesis protein ThiS [Porphyromonas macacae]